MYSTLSLSITTTHRNPIVLCILLPYPDNPSISTYTSFDNTFLLSVRSIPLMLFCLMPLQSVHSEISAFITLNDRKEESTCTYLVKASPQCSQVTFGLSLMVAHNVALFSDNLPSVTSSPSRRACRAICRGKSYFLVKTS